MDIADGNGWCKCGKTRRTKEIKAYFETEHSKTVHVVSESSVVEKLAIGKNNLFLDSAKEKQVRGMVKAEAERLIGREEVVIIDALNYIKGCRYELYCLSKSSKTLQCIVLCEVPLVKAWEWNCRREDKDAQYNQETFDALVMRYEPPDSRNRWDAPLFTLLPEDKLPAEAIYAALFERKPPPPHQSTQCAPLSSTNFLYELDRITQDIVSAILSAQKLGIEGEVKVPGCEEKVMLPGSSVNAPQLTRLRRQFLTYTKLHPTNDTTKLASLFVQFLNKSLN